jgi:uncharacterized protein YcaQ
VPPLTWDRVRGWRLARHHLDRRVPARRLTDVVTDVCGIHAQVQSAAELQIWARVGGVTPEDVREALWEERRLVRTWAMRGTLHVLTAEDLPLYAAALGTIDRWKGVWLKYVGLTQAQFEALIEAIQQSLGARPITREQLAEKVAERVGPAAQERMRSGWGELLKPAAFRGSLISGPPRGQNVTFVRPDRWLGRWPRPDGDASVREVLRRYLHTFGPATHDDFARWWGVQPAPARRILRSMPEDEVAEVEVGDTTASALAADVPLLGKASPRGIVRLLPMFDHYVVGFRPREEIVEKRFAPRVFRKAAWISQTVLVDGRIAGIWAHEKAGRRIEVTVEPFARLAAATKKVIADEADRLGRFLGAPATVAYSA